MRKAAVCLALLFLVALLPSLTFTEDVATVRLAQTIYALTRADTYESKLAVGSVVLNRVDSPWYPDDLMQVLSQAHQFPCGTRYDQESLRAAHAVLAGTRTLPPDVLYYQAVDASNPWQSGLYRVVDGYGYYTEDGNA